MKPQQVAFDMTMEDLEVYFRRTQDKDPMRRRRRAFRVVAVALVVFAAYMGVNLKGRDELAESMRWFDVILFSALGVFVWHVASPGWQAWGIRRNFEREGGRIRLGPWTVAIGPEGVMGTSPVGTQVVRWHAIREVDLTPELVILWLDQLLAVIVPARAFPDRWAMEQFAESARVYRDQEAPMQAELA
jgi:hypothetical protein